MFKNHCRIPVDAALKQITNYEETINHVESVLRMHDAGSGAEALYILLSASHSLRGVTYEQERHHLPRQ